MSHPASVVSRSLALLLLWPSLLVGGEGYVADARGPRPPSDRFTQLDADGDGTLGLKESLNRDDSRARSRRDHLLFDFDRDNALDRSEFSLVAEGLPPWMRGNVPDPIDDLSVVAAAALDESYDHWNRRPSELVNAHTFVANFISSISHGDKRFVTGRIISQADTDADGRMSRREAKLFLEQQLGIHWNGQRLRETSGRLLRLEWFFATDADHSHWLSREEFATYWHRQQSVDADFHENDRDGDGRVTIAEFAHHESGNYFDLIQWFRDADTDLDAHLSRVELAAHSPPGRRHLVDSTLVAFDGDADGRLSLREYQLSIHGNVNYPWGRQPIDRDRSGNLSYDEFVFHEVDQFQLLRRYFFHRLDRNGDGRLSMEEFPFRRRTPSSIHRLTEAGSIKVYQSAEYPRCGWPSIAPDGRSILFHRFTSDDDEAGRVTVMDVGDGSSRDVCDGSHPGWSPDGSRIVCLRQGAQSGIWIVNADGSDARRIASGVAPSWSPDGNSIAYLNRCELWVYDLATDKRRKILAREDHRFGDFGPDLAWSEDSGQLVGIGRRARHADAIVMVDVVRQTWKVRWFAGKQPSMGALDWTPDGRILFAMHDSGEGRNRLFALAAAGDGPPVPLEVGTSRNWTSVRLAPAQDWYVAVSDE